MNDEKDSGDPRTYPRKWESIDTWTTRLRVVGGWLVVRSGTGAPMLFLSDPKHEWQLEPK